MSADHPKLAKRARLRWDERDQAYLLLYPERGLRLTDSAAEILKLCDGTRSIEEIATMLSEHAKAPIDAVRADVRAFLERLEKKKLID